MKLIRYLPSSLLMLVILTICLRARLFLIIIFLFRWLNSSVYQCISPSVCLIFVPIPELFPI